MLSPAMIIFILHVFSILTALEQSSAFSPTSAYAMASIVRKETTFLRSREVDDFGVRPHIVDSPSPSHFSVKFRYSHVSRNGRVGKPVDGQSTKRQVQKSLTRNVDTRDRARNINSSFTKRSNSTQSAKFNIRKRLEKSEPLQAESKSEYTGKRVARNSSSVPIGGLAVDQNPGPASGHSASTIFDWPPKEPAGEGLPFGDGWRALYLDKQVSALKEAEDNPVARYQAPGNFC